MTLDSGSKEDIFYTCRSDILCSLLLYCVTYYSLPQLHTFLLMTLPTFISRPCLIHSTFSHWYLYFSAFRNSCGKKKGALVTRQPFREVSQGSERTGYSCQNLYRAKSCRDDMTKLLGRETINFTSNTPCLQSPLSLSVFPTNTFLCLLSKRTEALVLLMVVFR